MSAQQAKVRRIVWTGSIAAITMLGSWYGAGLKTQVDSKKMIQQRREASTEDKLKELDKQRNALVAKKWALEKKLRELEIKMRERARKEIDDNAT